MNLRALCCVLFVALCASSSISAQNSLNEYILANDYTPVPANSTNYVPGLLIAVNLQTGSWEPIDLQDDAKNAKLQAYSDGLDKTDGAKNLSVDAAVSGIETLFGGGVAVGFTHDTTVTFSGVKMNGFRLVNKEQDLLLQNHTGDTYKAVRHWADYKNVAILLVTQVGSAKSAEVKTSKANGFAAGVGTTADASCTAPVPSTGDTTKPQTSGALATVQKTVSVTQVAKVKVCPKSNDHVTFESETFVPFAMKVKFVYSLPDGRVDTWPGEEALHLWDKRRLKTECKRLSERPVPAA